jgi:hypothetical protein
VHSAAAAIRNLKFREEDRKNHAVITNTDGSGSGRSSALAGKQLRSDGRVDQIDLERGRSDRRGLVAHERFRFIA